MWLVWAFVLQYYYCNLVVSVAMTTHSIWLPHCTLLRQIINTSMSMIPTSLPNDVSAVVTVLCLRPVKKC